MNVIAAGCMIYDKFTFGSLGMEMFDLRGDCHR